jgi:hypothetical protein
MFDQNENRPMRPDTDEDQSNQRQRDQGRKDQGARKPGSGGQKPDHLEPDSPP